MYKKGESTMKLKNKNTGEVISFEPIMIDSYKVSAQSRKRLYWSNWEMKQPEDKGIRLKDIAIDKAEERHYFDKPSLTKRDVDFNKANKNKSIRVGHFNKGGQADRIYSLEGKSVTLSDLGGGTGAKTGLYYIGETLDWNDFQVRKLAPIECDRLQNLPDDYTKFGNDDGTIIETTDNMRYKGCGNGWTVGVIEHIFRGEQ